MKSLIIYSSKFGCTTQIVKKIAKVINADIINLKENDVQNILSYDRIIVGSSIYAGSINKKIKKFFEKNIEILKSKKIALFICGLNGVEFEKVFNLSFPLELRKISIANGMFTGEIIFSKLNWFEKFIVKKIMKTDKDICKLDFNQVDIFIKELK